jgi:hypothetical protein
VTSDPGQSLDPGDSGNSVEWEPVGDLADLAELTETTELGVRGGRRPLRVEIFADPRFDW